MASFYRKQCLTCDESFDAQVDRAYQDICPKCQKYMDATEPKTDDERKMNDYIQGLNDNALGAVGMGGYFSGLDRAQHQQASAQHEQTPLRAPAPFQAPETSTEMPETPRMLYPNPLSPMNASAANFNPGMTYPNPLNTMTVGAANVNTGMPATYPMPVGAQQHQQPPLREPVPFPAVEAPTNMPQQPRVAWPAPTPQGWNAINAGAPAADFGIDMPYAMPGTAQQGAPPAAPSMMSPPAEGQEDVPVAKTPKKGGKKRMVCRHCRKDMPITKHNDGVNCTRCYNKIRKYAEREDKS